MRYRLEQQVTVVGLKKLISAGFFVTLKTQPGVLIHVHEVNLTYKKII